LIDLHCHTTESDGTVSPGQLVELAKEIGIEALAITDHDTLAGYDAALPLATELGLELLCGIELSTKLTIAGRKRAKSVHLLAYFVNSAPTAAFRQWLIGMQESRRDRNIRLIARLRELGLDIELEEVKALGRSMTGRPHFARVLLDKGYVQTLQEAFDRYLDEAAPGYVDRIEPAFAEAVERIRAAGGISSLAHPIRLAATRAWNPF
jgi:predicted metal-dependent phosphoesterase TrpH